jgi:hypothetical protein
MSASSESVDDRLQNGIWNGNILDASTLASLARGTEMKKGVDSTSTSNMGVSQHTEPHRHTTRDDPHQAALEDNPEKAERLNASSLLAVFVG